MARSPVQSRTLAPLRILIYFQNTTTNNIDGGRFFIYAYSMSMPKKIRNKCLQCEQETKRPAYKYCSNVCQLEYQYQVYIEKWKVSQVSGLQGIGIVSAHIKKYLRRKFGNVCSLCGWSRVNEKTGKVPLVADHIDGNWRNNIESNLRLVCPNCDALSPTYAGSNRGNGRKNRVVSKRAHEGRLLSKVLLV